jgi:hypothetical protein
MLLVQVMVANRGLAPKFCRTWSNVTTNVAHMTPLWDPIGAWGVRHTDQQEGQQKVCSGGSIMAHVEVCEANLTRLIFLPIRFGCWCVSL